MRLFGWAHFSAVQQVRLQRKMAGDVLSDHLKFSIFAREPYRLSLSNYWQLQGRPGWQVLQPGTTIGARVGGPQFVHPAPLPITAG